MTDEVEWQEIPDRSTYTPSTLPPFQEAAGPTVSMAPDEASIDYFQLFISDDILGLIMKARMNLLLQRSRSYGQRGSSLMGHGERSGKTVSRDDKRRVLCVIPNMGIIQCSDMESYWKMQWTCYIPFFHDVMPKNRFFWMLHYHLSQGLCHAVLTRYSHTPSSIRILGQFLPYPKCLHR